MSDKPDQSEWFVEIPTEKIDRYVIASTIRDVTPEDIEIDTKLAAEGKCPHRIVYDTRAYMYDIRTCAICGEPCGLI